MNIDKSEALRYLGYNGTMPDDRTAEQVDHCFSELEKITVPRSLNRIFPVDFEPEGVKIGNMRISSRDLCNHLSGCREAVVFAATLGTQSDLLLRRYSKTDMSKAVILQACAAAFIESYCDSCCDELSREAALRGLYLRPRYSPGYGDFPIKYQPELLRVLDCEKKIGLTATASFMLAPSKSVTAVIGLTAEKKSCHIAKCMDCTASNCPFRKG